MRRLSDEKKAVFLQAHRRGDGDFVIVPHPNVTIKNGMDLTVYAKPVDNRATMARFTIGSGKVRQGKDTTLKLTRQDGRIKLNDDLQYFVRVPRKKSSLQERILRALISKENDD